MRPLRTILLGLTSLLLTAQTPTDIPVEASAIPVAINLPTTESLQAFDFGILFTHRFLTAARGNSKEAYGLDGYAFSGIGIDFGIKQVKGLNLQLYRTSDQKTFTLALQQRVLDAKYVRMAVRLERFDETVQHNVSVSNNTIGLVGGAFQVPVDFFLPNNVTLSLVPTYLTTSTSYLQRSRQSVFNMGLGASWKFLENQALLAEYYPRPSGLNKDNYRSGWAYGYGYGTYKHQFRAVITNVEGTTAHQVLGGDFSGGPRPSGQWSLGFNVTRVF